MPGIELAGSLFEAERRAFHRIAGYIEAPPPPPQTGTPPGTGTSPSAAGTWCYCESAKAYYPYVSDRKEGWRSVPAAPQQAR